MSNNITFQLPPIKEKSLLGTLFTYKNKNSNLYDVFIQFNPGSSIKTRLQEFFNRIEVRQDLVVMERLNLGFCRAQGTNFSTKGYALISLAPGFDRLDTNACSWLIKHEIFHIKNNDNLTIPLVSAIFSIAAATFSTFMMPVIPALFLTISVGFIAKTIFSQYREGKADDLAIAESSVEELKGGRRFFMSSNNCNIQSRKTIWDRIMISPTGEHRLNFSHPSTKSRIKKIEDALAKPGRFN